MTTKKTMTTHDFGDGEVPAHQHPNGGGWVSDDSTVSEDSYIDGDASVYGGSVVSGSRVSGSTVSGGSIAFIRNLEPT